MEKARPHPNLLPQEKGSGWPARCVIGGELAHHNLHRAITTMADERCSLSSGRGRGEGEPLTDKAAALFMTRLERKLHGP